jgi:hypothetical protein
LTLVEGCCVHTVHGEGACCVVTGVVEVEVVFEAGWGEVRVCVSGGGDG